MRLKSFKNVYLWFFAISTQKAALMLYNNWQGYIFFIQLIYIRTHLWATARLNKYFCAFDVQLGIWNAVRSVKSTLRGTYIRIHKSRYILLYMLTLTCKCRTNKLNMLSNCLGVFEGLHVCVCAICVSRSRRNDVL